LIRSRYNEYRFGKLMEEYFQFTQKDASSYIVSFFRIKKITV